MGSRLLLGLGNCVDYEIGWDAQIFNDLIAHHGIHLSELDPWIPVVDERSLLLSVLGYFQAGEGGERGVSDVDTVKDFARHFTVRPSLGGTNVRAAIALARIGVPTRLHLVCANATVRALLPGSCSYITSSLSEELSPHLIVQFSAGDEILIEGRPLVAARANRAIYVNDVLNQSMKLADNLGAEVKNSLVFLIAGVNAITEDAVLRDRMEAIRTICKSAPDTYVVYEDAGFHDPSTSEQVIRTLADVIDLHGMNEDEFQVHVGRKVDLLSAEDVHLALLHLRERLAARILVVHTKDWALAFGDRASEFRDSLVGGIKLAVARYCHGDDFSPADVDAVSNLQLSEAGRDFARAIEALSPGTITCVPGPKTDVLRPTTVGLGDTFVGGFLAGLPAIRQE